VHNPGSSVGREPSPLWKLIENDLDKIIDKLRIKVRSLSHTHTHTLYSPFGFALCLTSRLPFPRSPRTPRRSLDSFACACSASVVASYA
jgi:hypothetical protein